MTGRPPHTDCFLPALVASLALCLVLIAAPRPASSQTLAPSTDTSILEAREAARRRDRPRLAAVRASVQAAQHPLTPWVEYWDLTSRLGEARVDEVEAFYARWPGSYVEDRLRNDWLQELGRRRDWTNIARDYPRFRMNDDREVTCWWLLTEHLAGREVREAARAAWLAQREQDEGCNLLATAMVDGRKFSADDVWRKARLSVEANRPGLAKTAIGLLGNGPGREASEAIDSPLPYVRKHRLPITRNQQELKLLAVMRLAANDTDVAAAEIDGRGRGGLPPSLAAWGWAYIGRQAAFKLSPEAASHFHRAWGLLSAADVQTAGWTDDTLAAAVRAALRATRPAERWPMVIQAVNAMSAAEQANPTWAYWRARAWRLMAKEGPAGDEQRADARRALEAIAGPLGFYQQLAAEDLGHPLTLPAAPEAPTEAEQEAARRLPGLSRAMLLAGMGLRDEARREWNFTLRGMSDRELIVAARLACSASDWQICINTSERTRSEFDVFTRYPTPFSAEIHRAAAAAGLDTALVFGLIRQETRFMPQIRSHVGAAGLMQLMPATARYMAKRVGLAGYKPDQVTDTTINLQLGSGYLKLVLDDLGGSQAMAAAAYNAGPGRPRKWREGPVLETAAWAENVPFNETRDYVKKVLANAVVYAAVLKTQPASLKARLGPGIGPRDGAALPANTELP